MNQITFTTLSEKELRLAMREEVREELATILKALGKKEEPLMSSKQAAALLGISLSTLYSFVSQCAIPYMKRGNRLYFRKEELLQWLEDGHQLLTC